MPGDVRTQLADALQALASDLPPELVLRVAQLIAEKQTAPLRQRDAQVLAALSQPAPRERVRSLLDLWHTAAPDLPASAISLALQTSARTAEHFRQLQALELVWTGPDSEIIPVRRTDQALLQLINTAQQRLLIVSFAVYKADAIAQALVQAARRRVIVDICLETADSSEGKVEYDMFAALGSEIRRQARLYVWPLGKRPVSPAGHYGSLHAKVAVADSASLLISSANLTEYAMTLNMEMGLMVRGGELPRQVERHFAHLIDRRVLEAIG